MAEAILMKGGGTVYSEDCTAASSHILNGRTALFNGSNDDIGTGDMPNNSGVLIQHSNSVGAALQGTVRIENLAVGYYDSNSTVAAPLTTQKFGTAGRAHVLTGKTFLSGSVSQTTSGTMPDFSNTSNTNCTVSKNQDYIYYKVPTSGMYNSNTSVRAASSVFGTATRGQVLNGMTFTSTAGLKTTGTMPNHNATSTNTATAFSSNGSLWIKSLSNSGYYTSSTSVKTNIPVYTGGYSVS